MPKVESHFGFWPVRVPRSLPLPETSVFDNLSVSARGYPGKPAIPYYGTEIPYRRLLEDLGPGQEGEIVVSGPQVMWGYWRRPEADEEAFFEKDGRRFFGTGDIVVRDEEGYFLMVDRLKRMINASVYKVWPAEVESTLHGHPAIQEA